MNPGIPRSALVVSSVIVLYFGLLAPGNFAASQDSSDIDLLPSIDTDSAIVSGRIAMDLEPVTADQMTNDANAMSDMMSQAQRFSMSQNVTWLLSGDWALISDTDGRNTTFAAEFIKATIDGQMVHTHSITNFTSPESISPASLQDNATIAGTADVYFNGELAWKQVDTNLTLTNGTVLRIDLDSSDVDRHFHGQPIYGLVNSLAKNGTVMTIPETNISEEIEEEVSELRANATQAGQNIANQASEAAGTFAEEAVDVMSNITQSVRDLFR